MKTKTPKTLKKPKVKAKRRAAFAPSKKVVYISVKLPGIRHFRLITHKHTGKLIHHRHTSHLALFVMLLVVGFIMYNFGGIALAYPAPSSGSVTVGAVVPMPPPKTGAVITSPVDGYTEKGQLIESVSGTCLEQTFVVIQDNGVTAGSASCSDTGTFTLQVQLGFGDNVLTALNYDNLNQAGPATASVTVTVTKSDYDTTPLPSTQATAIVAASIPDNPSIIAGVPSTSTYSSCTDYVPGYLPTGGPLHVSVVCVPRLFNPGTEQTMGVIVWGGTPPYALSINFGDNSANNNPTLISLPSPGYKPIQFSYAVPNTYQIKFRLTDQQSQTAVVQTAVQVNGQTEASAASTSVINNLASQIFGGKPWYESPVPFYLLAIAITLGFWGGDIFDRNFGAKALHPRSRARA
jgi:hypothetical protein